MTTIQKNFEYCYNPGPFRDSGVRKSPRRKFARPGSNPPERTNHAHRAREATHRRQRNPFQSCRSCQRSPALSSERLRELLRLRGEVGLLRRQQLEADEAAAANGVPSQRTSVVNRQSNAPAPFQVQLVLDKPGENTEAITNSATGRDGELWSYRKLPLLDYTAD